MIRYHIIVSGFVQGVGFRYFSNHTARSLGLTGWVRNLYDGSVELEAQGREEDILAFIDRLREGSRYSEVENVSFERIDVLNQESSFKIADW